MVSPKEERENCWGFDCWEKRGGFHYFSIEGQNIYSIMATLTTEPQITEYGIHQFLGVSVVVHCGSVIAY